MSYPTRSRLFDYSSNRFQRAKFQLVDLMVDRTGPGVRLQRDAVRDIVRHAIRDTGLLDYLLKASPALCTF